MSTFDLPPVETTDQWIPFLAATLLMVWALVALVRRIEKRSKTCGATVRSILRMLGIVGCFAAPVFVLSVFEVLSHADYEFDRLGLSLLACGVATFLVAQVGVALIQLAESVKGDGPLRNAILWLYTDVLSIWGLCAIAYKIAGLERPNYGDLSHSWFDAIYFSVATFATLGYGDFRPSSVVRVVALTEALMGMLMLGAWIAIFVALARGTRTEGHGSRAG